MNETERASGRLALLVYGYTALCVVGAVAVFLGVATWHFTSHRPHQLPTFRADGETPPSRAPDSRRPPPRHGPGDGPNRPPPRRGPGPEVGSGQPVPPGISPPPDVLFIVGGTLLGLVAIASFFFARRITTPLRDLEAAAMAFGQGKYDVRVNSQKNDELGAASRAFDKMASQTSRLIESQKELIANVSHELRTPLARMRVALDMAAEREQASPALLENLNLDVAELQSLVGEVLDTLRAAMAGELHDIEAIELTEFVTETVGAFQQRHPGRVVTLQTAELARCRLEPLLFSRALGNLLENAVKYSEGTVVVSVSRAKDTATIRVTDVGIGISEADQAKVFTPFFRVDPSRHRKTGGVGLGLNLVKRIVEAHNGNVSIESEVGAGTTAQIELPIAKSA